MSKLSTLALALAAVCGVAGSFPGTAMAEAVGSCRLPSSVSSEPLGAPPPDEVHAGVATAAFLLSLIWSPEECRSHGEGAGADTQCRDNRFGFTVHGLWPNGTGNYHPRYCHPVAPVDEATVRANLCMTPSVHLLQHEWAAHGACGWATPAAYFAQERRLREAIDVPTLSPRPDGFLTAGEIRDAFISRNPSIPRTALDVHVGHSNRLEEVRVCYDLSFKYAPCLSGSGAPDAAAVGVTAE